MMVMAGHGGLRQIRDVRELVALRRVGEIGGKLVERVGLGRVPARLSGGRGLLQVGRELLRDLLVFGRIALLQLLQGAHQLRKRRELRVVVRGVRRLGCGVRPGGAARGTGDPQERL